MVVQFYKKQFISQENSVIISSWKIEMGRK
jgi:hypothetical protein